MEIIHFYHKISTITDNNFAFHVLIYNTFCVYEGINKLLQIWYRKHKTNTVKITCSKIAFIFQAILSWGIYIMVYHYVMDDMLDRSLSVQYVNSTEADLFRKWPVFDLWSHPLCVGVTDISILAFDFRLWYTDLHRLELYKVYCGYVCESGR